MHICHIIGARPQFVKAAVVLRACTNEMPSVQQTVIHTGQHYDKKMSDIFFDEMKIPKPDIHLGIGGCSHGAMTGRMLEQIEQVLIERAPDWVVVYGDTNSTLAAAIAASKLHIPVAHVEAGLRSFNRRMPEEINRILTDHCSTLLLAPTQVAVEHLKAEGIPQEKIRLTGDVMFDATLHYQKLGSDATKVKGRYVLATIHRAENTDDRKRLLAIVDGLVKLGKEMIVVLPVHPRTRSALEDLAVFEELSMAIKLVEPVGYLEMLQLEAGAALIVTDSGGVQKEAFFSKVPCLTLRDETEWIELVEHGFNKLVNVIHDDLCESANEMLTRFYDWDIDLYGRGNAGENIAAALMEHALCHA